MMPFLRNPRRLLVMLLLLLAWGAGGALVNVAVAWGCAIYAPLSSQYHHSEGLIQSPANQGDYIEEYAYDGFGRHRAFLDNESLTFVESAVKPRWSYLDRAGCPALSMAGRLDLFDGDPDWERPSWSILPPLWLSSQSTHDAKRAKLVPLKPIWPGFAINTVFYAGILWLLFAAPFALRRRRRIKRGLCLACAYPVGNSAVCTECGSAVTPRRRAGM